MLIRLHIGGVPLGKSIYGIAIGNEARGAVKFTADQIRLPLELTIS